MSLPTKTTISKGEYSADGSPWIQIAAKSSINIDTLEYSADGSPWYGTEAGTIKTRDGIAISNLKTINGVAIGHIKTINGITV